MRLITAISLCGPPLPHHAIYEIGLAVEISVNGSWQPARIRGPVHAITPWYKAEWL